MELENEPLCGGCVLGGAPQVQNCRGEGLVGSG